MIRDIVSALDYSSCAEFALALFVAAFATITYGTLRLSRDASDRFASIPLSDCVEDPRHERLGAPAEPATKGNPQ